MSGKLVNLVMRGVHGIPLRAKCVLVVLAETCATPSALAFPGVTRISRILNTGERQVREALDLLVDVRWIKPKKGTGHGPGNPAKYEIDFAAMHLPAEEFDRSKGDVRIVAKPSDEGRIKSPNVGRNASAAKRPFMGFKASESTSKAPHVGGAKRPPGGNETELSLTSNGFEPEHATSQSTYVAPKSLQQIVTPFIKKLKGEPERRPKPASLEDQLAYVALHATPKPTH